MAMRSYVVGNIVTALDTNISTGVTRYIVGIVEVWPVAVLTQNALFRVYIEFGTANTFNYASAGKTLVFPSFTDSTQGGIVAPIFMFPRSRHYVRR